MDTKYIYVVGGVMSGVGKGIATASIGKVLQSKGYSVSAIKIDPYINVDAGTMNPTEHGEVFVLEDGLECDQDMGNYERFLDADLYSSNYMTTGSVYLSVIQRERNLEYEGKCVEVVPHIPMEVRSRITEAAEKTSAEIMLIEIGGTVGEYQNLLFLEAARMMKLQHPKDVAFVLVSYMPIPHNIGEMKTKPTQYAIRTLNSAGIQPDFVLCRGEKPLDDVRRKKISINGNVPREHVISAPDIDHVYEVPLNFDNEHLAESILKQFNLEIREKNNGLSDWKEMVQRIKSPERKVRIGIVGKYFNTGDFVLSDSYISVIEAVKHASWINNADPEITWLSSETYEEDESKLEELSQFDGVIVPGGFGTRGIEGKIKAIRYVRENKIPYLGLCYGLQLATVEFARNVAGIKDATTAEIDDKAENQVIHVMPEQIKKLQESDYGATMRLGAYPCLLNKKSKSYKAYGKEEIFERHRHRYEFNNDYREQLEKAGLLIAGTSPDKKLVEVIELPEHPFFVGTQFHPEFKSRPVKGHPIFNEFIKVSLEKANA